MIQHIPPLVPTPVIYPESDGLPMSDNTKQFCWIVVLYGNLAALFRQDDEVFVCGNQFWYPVEGRPDIVAAPDVYVAFGRPKGHRSSYRQWEEGNVPMTVVFEVLSPKNTFAEMADKMAFYDEYGVEEYYIYDPDTNRLLVYLRRGEALRRIWQVDGFVSPRLGIRFDLSGPEMVVFRPDGRRFLSFEELEVERAAAEDRAGQAEDRAGQAEVRAGQAEVRAGQAEVRAGQAEQRAGQAEHRVARLTELVRKVRQNMASVEELAELEQLLEPPPPSET